MKVEDAVAKVQNDVKEYEYELINAKLNLDAIEIESKLAQTFSKEVGLWEETAALKVVKQHIKSINETVTNRQVLIDRDEAMHKPLLEKWFNAAADDVLNRPNSSDTLKHLSSTMKDDLNDGKNDDEERKHLQVRPKIGLPVSN